MIQEFKTLNNTSQNYVLSPFSETEITNNIKNMIKSTIISDNKSISSDSHLLDHLNDQIEDPYKLIESYFEGKYLERLVRHQIESYNHFINYQIQRTIKMFNSVKLTGK